MKDEVIEDILHNYLKEGEVWYPLGASEAKPIKGGLGDYVQRNFPSLTSRHASAIAAILVHDGLLESMM